MNYIYDIVLNFNNNYYEFYEWDKNDNIINIRKIPVIRINDSSYYDWKFNEVVVNLDFLSQIYDQTTVYVGSKSKYLCIITNQKEAMGVMFNKKGNIIKKSSLILDEEDEVLELSLELETEEIKYIVTKENKDNFKFISRGEKETKQRLLNNINQIYQNNNIDLIKYIYYDCFEKEETDLEKIKEKIIKLINSNNTFYINKLNDTLKLANINNH